MLREIKCQYVSFLYLYNSPDAYRTFHSVLLGTRSQEHRPLTFSHLRVIEILPKVTEFGLYFILRCVLRSENAAGIFRP